MLIANCQQTLAYQIYLYGIREAGWPQPEDTSRFDESLSEEVWMKKVREKNTNYNGVNSHYEIYTNFLIGKIIN